MNTCIIFYEPRLFDNKLFHLVELFFHKERNGTLKQWILSLRQEIFILFSMELDKLSLITVSSNFHRGKINRLNFNPYETRRLFHSIWKSIILLSPAVSTIIG